MLWEEHKDKILLFAVVILILAVFLFPKMKTVTSLDENGIETQSQSQTNYDLGTVVSSSQTSSSVLVSENTGGTKNTTTQKISVDVKGAVIHPGVVWIDSDQRVDAVLKKVGGANKNADLDQVNLAHKLSDQMLIYIPAKGEQTQISSPVLIGQDPASETQGGQESVAESTLETAGGLSQEGRKINLNSATKEQLTELNGIGDKKADQILAYRQQNGNFKTIEDLKNVSGIGDKIFAGLAEQVTVN